MQKIELLVKSCKLKFMLIKSLQNEAFGGVLKLG